MDQRSRQLDALQTALLLLSISTARGLQVVIAQISILAASWPPQVVRFACRRHVSSQRVERATQGPLGVWGSSRLDGVIHLDRMPRMALLTCLQRPLAVSNQELGW
ncbi:hypothetical protein SCLCIDRAFT_838376 [Scleroderma citrinum Foug A]|uniref:Secreted protein n=1 Tax=Scleroderma citrinum Foug A TaxID=1036808 RepID=A0A0C3E134_9AGAM|nr:hypothetical protein SCLCIDRAFT_838376 [Scleroderma citrinum Foug A]